MSGPGGLGWGASLGSCILLWRYGIEEMFCFVVCFGFPAALGIKTHSAFEAGLSPTFCWGVDGVGVEGKEDPSFFPAPCHLSVKCRWTQWMFWNDNPSKIESFLRGWSCLFCSHLPRAGGLGCEQFSVCPRDHPEWVAHSRLGGNEGSLSPGHPRSGLGLPLGILLWTSRNIHAWLDSIKFLNNFHRTHCCTTSF